MRSFYDFLKKYKTPYIIVISGVATIIIINEVIQFAEIVINNKLLLFFSILVFIFITWLAVRNRMWENGEEDKE